MKYISFVVLLALFFIHLGADTVEIEQVKSHAKLCQNPAIAEDKFDASFRYGCFCGKGYPNIQHSSKKPYRYLNRKEKDELIAQYYTIKPYDSIDAACRQHDICYINKGREDQTCNDTLQIRLRELEETFEKQADYRERDSLERRCKILASDMDAVFRTIFGTGDNVSVMRFGMLAVTTPLTLASKTFQKTSRDMSNGDDYPKKGEKCIVK